MTAENGPTGSPSPDSANPAGLGGLLAGLVAGLAQLFRHEVDLARAEARQSLSRVKAALALIVVALILAFVGLHVAAATATAALVALGVGPVLSPAIVTAVVLGVALLCLWAAARRLSAASLIPHRTVDAVRRTGKTIVNMVKSDA